MPMNIAHSERRNSFQQRTPPPTQEAPTRRSRRTQDEEASQAAPSTARPNQQQLASLLGFARTSGGSPAPDRLAEQSKVGTPSKQNPSVRGAELLQSANRWKGVDYLYGGNSRAGIDCSHFVHQAYKGAGFDYTYRTTEGPWAKAGFEKTQNPKAGDLIMFKGHMGIVVDPDKKTFIGAQSSTGVAQASYGKSSYWGKQAHHFLHHPRVKD